MKVLFLEDTMWDYDFIINDILHNIPTEIEIYKKQTFKALIKRNDIIENNILIINRACNIYDIIDVVKCIKPIVIFYMSDEVGNIPNTTKLEKYTKLLFRQYNHKTYNYSANNYQIPLGYCKYFLRKLSYNPTTQTIMQKENNISSVTIEPKKMKDRTINCSFIGSRKSDREEMTEKFKNNMTNTNIIFVSNYWDLDKLPYKPEECFEIYNNSIFVICGRGNSSLDCYRIYEAIVAGAIPVVVGKLEEINVTFSYNNNNNNNIIPMIYEENWNNAVKKCNELLEDNNTLQKIQDDLLAWWRNQIGFINGLIQKEINPLHST